MRARAILLAFLFSFHLFAADIFQCPMLCEGEKTYATKVSCPVCGMVLEKKGEGGRPLNTRDYRMDLATNPSAVKAGEKVVLTLTPRRTKDNSVVTPLEIVHEKPMHLILVSQELDWFAHEHPEAQKDGSYRLEFVFPARGGNFVLYSDVTPPGDRNQVFPLALQVEAGKSKSKPAPLKENVGQTRKVGDYSVTLKVTPTKHGAPVNFEYQVKKAGKFVTDLEPYLAAAGHLVIVSEDTTQFLHAHPAGDHHGHHGHAPAKISGEKDLKFATAFPRPGLYKAWLQFKHAGQIHTADFVVKAR